MEMMLNLTPQQKKVLDEICNAFNLHYGSHPSPRQLVYAIANRQLTVVKARSDSPIEATKAADPLALARKHANLASVVLGAGCDDLALPHISLALAYTLMGITRDDENKSHLIQNGVSIHASGRGIHLYIPRLVFPDLTGWVKLHYDSDAKRIVLLPASRRRDGELKLSSRRDGARIVSLVRFLKKYGLVDIIGRAYPMTEENGLYMVQLGH